MTDLPYLPAHCRVYAVGDIHGGINLLEKLLDVIMANETMLPDRKTVYLVFLGDYIDRGEASRQVVDCLLTGLPPRFTPVFLMGNHEAMMLDSLSRENRGNMVVLDHWLHNGGNNTLKSYGVENRGYPEEIQADFILSLPKNHLTFYAGLQPSFEIGQYFFCHAGIRPGVALADQKEVELLWIRSLFLNSTADHGKIIVHGHTPEIARHHGNRIGLDSGSVMSGKLSALRLEPDGSHDIMTVVHDETWSNV